MLAACLPAVAKAPSAPRPLTAAERQIPKQDWPDLARYRDENAKLPPLKAGEKRVVFMGDSITDLWGRNTGVFFPGKPYVNRGISGQTTPQMLVRFRQDVIALKPKAVVILAGINDIAGNTGYSTLPMIEDNLASMAEIANANGIHVVMASVTPAYDFPWRQGLEPVGKIRELNEWIKTYAARHHAVYLDYYSALVDDKGGMKEGLSSDGVHPTAAGYEIMSPLAQKAIDKALKAR
jgi:lysophospholipase L1-like esterase